MIRPKPVRILSFVLSVLFLLIRIPGSANNLNETKVNDE